ncbi:hypothetical protein SAMN05216559_0126 [Halomicrobium zhouii]|uniref:Putative peptidase inhibitor domain-containing protein n=1 Tax=Halomicrobium zhouii TaxID=767519 RepID=A0A1I6K4E1_9EURY|nr:hypothetical protein [Halomicrobium zhouii]SFR85710.1 hypothetical protein SAMN05216559_0126 [Halomicrobium zhouii]
MHVSRAVATIRDDPVPGEEIDLVFETDPDADLESVVTHLEAAGATIDRHLQFDDLLATVRHEDVEAVCHVRGVDAVQTADAIGIHPDEAEEDFEPAEEG